jgi:DEAD/DEAH box helicase domain-containing protein
MRTVVFDIETSNQFTDVGSYEPAALSISVVGIYDSERDTYKCYTEEELPELWKLLEETDMLVGYNSDHFDIPLLNKYYPGDLANIKSLDLLKEIFNVLGRRIRLNAVAEGTLGEKKSGHGLEALKWWRNGEVQRVKDYCLKDVEITKNIFDYALKNGSLKYTELGKTNEVKLDTSNWLSVRDGAITHTLGL